MVKLAKSELVIVFCNFIKTAKNIICTQDQVSAIGKLAI